MGISVSSISGLIACSSGSAQEAIPPESARCNKAGEKTTPSRPATLTTIATASMPTGELAAAVQVGVCPGAVINTSAAVSVTSAIVPVSSTAPMIVADKSEQFSDNPSTQACATSASSGTVEIAISPGTQVTYLSASCA